MGIELVSPNAHERRPFLRTLHHLVGSFICFLRTLWTRLTQSHTPRASDLSFREPLLVDCEKGSLDVYQTRAQLLAALNRRDASDAAFEAQVTALLAPVKWRLAEITRDSGVPYPVSARPRRPVPGLMLPSAPMTRISHPAAGFLWPDARADCPCGDIYSTKTGTPHTAWGGRCRNVRARANSDSPGRSRLCVWGAALPRAMH
ncbi:hypothetical protein B0H19DRAFT_446194 [Mycena capillaripes]|nr:hypothetical protein B0H19DRAFT_446194 [Mycena capillaripes]